MKKVPRHSHDEDREKKQEKFSPVGERFADAAVPCAFPSVFDESFSKQVANRFADEKKKLSETLKSD